jgi:hypothetical protein
MDLQTAKMELLLDASKNRNQIIKVEKADGAYVKGHSLPSEVRSKFIAALDSLLQEGALKPIFKNSEMEMFAVTAQAAELTTLSSARQRILQEFQDNKYVYKIHSPRGEFVQCAGENFEQFEYSRILFMRALHELLYSGKIDVVSDCREICTYALSPTCPPWSAQTGFESKEHRLAVMPTRPTPTNIRSA